ncbi:hypothetical protein ABZ215_27795 [Amycolatopsis sp. NPDC006131]|uniref:hypothetical protein n=1 Tax=Amycolatopsis sp. NPDC006131 TaxID=3156731 RepID=UPI0033B789D7
MSIAACVLVSGYAVLLVASLLGAPIPASVLLPAPDAPAASPTPPPQGGPSVVDETTTPSHTAPSAEAADPSTAAPPPQAPAVTTTAAPQPPVFSEQPRNPRARPDPPGRGQDGQPEPGR